MAKKKKSKKLKKQLVYKKKIRRKKRRKQRQIKINLRNIVLKNIKDNNRVLPISNKAFKKLKKLSTLRELAETKARLSDVEQEIARLRKENERLRTELDDLKGISKIDEEKDISKIEKLSDKLIKDGKFETTASPVPERLRNYEDDINNVDELYYLIKWGDTDPAAWPHIERKMIDLGWPDEEIQRFFDNKGWTREE